MHTFLHCEFIAIILSKLKKPTLLYPFKYYISICFKLKIKLNIIRKKMSVTLAPTVSLPWVEKYRPRNLQELISQDNIIDTCKVSIHYMFFSQVAFKNPLQK